MVLGTRSTFQAAPTRRRACAPRSRSCRPPASSSTARRGRASSGPSPPAGSSGPAPPAGRGTPRAPHPAPVVRRARAVLVAVEYARAMRLGDPDAAGMLPDLDSDGLDPLADGVFLGGARTAAA